MLVLSRKKDEQIVIQLGNQAIFVRIVDIDGNKVRLGVTAPDEVAVDREEVWKRRKEFAAPATLPVPAVPALPAAASPPPLPQ